jgi:hypothetical protein
MHRRWSFHVKRAFFASVIFVAGMFAGAWLDDWLDIDTCYDRGGYFDRIKETCIY